MSEEPTFPDEDEEAGAPDGKEGAFSALLSPLRAFAGRSKSHLADYVRARTELFKIETEEAAAASKGLVTGAGLGAFLLIPGYTLCLFAVLVALAGLWNESRLGVLALVVGLVHIALGVVILLRTRAKARATRFFEESRAQLQRDQEWLHQLQQTPRPPTSAPGNPD